MRWLSFLLRVAFICNIFFLLSVVLHFSSFLRDQAIVSTVVIIGYVLSVFVFNPLANIICFMLLLFKKELFNTVPKWLVLTNFVFLILQIIYILLFLNDTVYN